ncbi:DUF1543 domain-containing protein [Pseudomonas sp. MWU13-2105]|uniref:DUF1543 domain-containing protein n=1 Tax=Pseudomonas sp. MWU13-2105 TaxID=2935074 RepID=UPI0020106618|nr:DUF1543 domain-containing protein [Pseudomonas sp. MWU13-2105]
MLFIVLLGGRHPKAKIEVHDVAFVNAQCLEDTFEELRKEWFGNQSGLHIDSWMQVDGVGDWKVEFSDLAPAPNSPHLYFVNMGGYDSRAFGEAHDYMLVVENSKAEAHAKTKKAMLNRWSEQHTDAVFDIDDCLPIFSAGGRYINLVKSENRGILKRNEYIIIPH